LRIHFDSLAEIDSLTETALDDGWRVGVRGHVSDEADSGEPAFSGQFGMSWHEATTSLCRPFTAGADLQSVHFHVGQCRHRTGAYLRAIAHVADLCRAALVHRAEIDRIVALTAGSAGMSNNYRFKPIDFEVSA
jgi:diaminopimelate decarboxylase